MPRSKIVEHATEMPPVARGVAILAVDDNKENLYRMASTLRPEGFEVRTACDGPSALASVKREPPDLILLDVTMPGMSGLEVLDRIREHPSTASIPVILVTARVEDADVLAGYRTGADYYITKPYTTRQLLYGVSLVLGRGAQE